MNQPKTYIIEQDQHLQNLRKIIQRDFFQKRTPNQGSSQQQTIRLSLNDYLANFKSNQSQIFTELVRSDAQQWKQKNKWMEKCSQLMIKSNQADKPYTNMIGKNPELKAIDHSRTKQQIKNGVFFSPSRETKSYQKSQHQRQKRILYDNCSIDNADIHEHVQYEQRNIQKDYQVEDIPPISILQGAKPIKNKDQDPKYKMMRQPSPEPQVMPIMTWGQVDSTPLRIKQYSIPEVPKKDQLLEELNSKIYREKKIKKDRKNQLKMKILSSVRNDISSLRRSSTIRFDSTKRQVKQEQLKIKKLDKLDKLLNFDKTKGN